jgi:hypothetical protein
MALTISSTSSSITVAGDGLNQSFSFPFVADSADNIFVQYVDADGAITDLNPSQYTLVINPAGPNQLWGVGGTVTYPLVGAPIAAGTYLSIQRILPFTQETTVRNQGNYYAQVTEQAIDELEMQIQQVNSAVSRSVQFPASDPSDVNPVLPSFVERANQYLGFDADGNAVALPGTGGSGGVISVNARTGNLTVTGSGEAIVTSPTSSTININVPAAPVVPGFDSYILSPAEAPEIPVSGLVVNLPAGKGIINVGDDSYEVTIPALTPTLAANSLFDAWLNTDGTWTFETQPVATYTELPHYVDKLHVWQIQTTTNIAAITLMANTFPSVGKPNDIAGTIDNFVQNFYLYTVTANWSASLAVTYGQLLVTSTGNVYQVKEPGTTGGSAPTQTAPGTFYNGTALLLYYCQSSYLGMFRYALNNGMEYYFTNIGLEQVAHKDVATTSPLSVAAGTKMTTLVKNHIQGVFKHLIGNRVNSGTYAFGMKMIAGGYIWLNTTVAGGTAAGSSPFSGTYTPGTSTVVDGTITWLCIYNSYASQQWFWMNVAPDFLTYRYPDSHDSYASTFASLVSRYIQLTGDVNWLKGASLQPSGSGTYWTYEQIFGYIMNANLDTQITNFLTNTFQNSIAPWDGSSFTIQYLEDNCESVKGFREQAYVYYALGDSTKGDAAIANVTYVGGGVAALYNTTYNLFATNYGQNVADWAENQEIGWYPYLQAQFFPQLCGVPTVNNDQYNLVRYNVSLKWPNYYNDKGVNAFPENFVGFMAGKYWQDTEKAYNFINKTERYFISGGSVEQGMLTQAGGTTIAEWGYYLATKDALVSPLTVLNSNNGVLNLLNQSNDVTPIYTNGVLSAVNKTAAFTLTLPANCYITDIFVQNTTANAVTGGLNIGTALSGAQVVSAYAVGANAISMIPSASILLKVFSRTAAQTLYFSAASSFNSAALNVEVRYNSL